MGAENRARGSGKRVLGVTIAALLGAACGGGSATGAEPVVSIATTTARHDVVDDRAAISQVEVLLRVASDSGFDNLRTLRLDGVTVVPADQPSYGPQTVSLAIYRTQTANDLGLAIRSDSGACLWFADVGGEERYGVGEPCTGLTALHQSTHDLPNDSPWRLVVGSAPDPSDPQALYELQAKSAQAVLRNALVSAKTYFSDAGTFRGMSVEALRAIEPGLTFVAVVQSTDDHTVSVVVTADRFGAAVQSDNGICYWITENVGLSRTLYGQGTPCTGTAALGASDTKWKAPD